MSAEPSKLTRWATWLPAPPCRPARGKAPAVTCAERLEHQAERLAQLGEEDDGTHYLVDVVADSYVCAITHCPWCGSRLRR